MGTIVSLYAGLMALTLLSAVVIYLGRPYPPARRGRHPG